MRPWGLPRRGRSGCGGAGVGVSGRAVVLSARLLGEAERADAVPAVFTRIRMVFVVSGEELRESAVRRAVDLSAEKYCSATAMLRPSVEITHEYRIEPA